MISWARKSLSSNSSFNIMNFPKHFHKFYFKIKDDVNMTSPMSPPIRKPLNVFKPSRNFRNKTFLFEDFEHENFEKYYLFWIYILLIIDKFTR